MPVQARRLSRRMRGGAQAHLLACEDGRFYVTKFLNNPQHRRILPNEWAATVLLRHLGIAAPEARIIAVDTRFLDSEPEAHFQLGSPTSAAHNSSSSSRSTTSGATPDWEAPSTGFSSPSPR